MATTDSTRHPIYSHKVFVGGLPHQITKNDLTVSFQLYGAIKDVFWPKTKQISVVNKPPEGYAFVIFVDKSGIDNLIRRLTVDKKRTFIRVVSGGDLQYVELKLWKLSDGLFVRNRVKSVYPKVAFIGGLRSGVTAQQLADELDKRFGKVAMIKMKTCGFGYPIGTAMVTFCEKMSFLAAMSLNKVLIAKKMCELKPFVVLGATKCACSQFAATMCIACHVYCCQNCYDSLHGLHDYIFKMSVANFILYGYQNKLSS